VLIPLIVCPSVTTQQRFTSTVQNGSIDFNDILLQVSPYESHHQAGIHNQIILKLLNSILDGYICHNITIIANNQIFNILKLFKCNNAEDLMY
jgi:hypothetical protein